jgi:hypothetical protein
MRNKKTGYTQIRDKEKAFQKFLVKAQKIHGNKWSYSKTQYHDSESKIEIICSVHGSFWRFPKTKYGTL